MHNDPTANNTQLVRHELQFASEANNEQLVAARELLTEHGFVVDTLAANEAVVTSAHGTDPDWQLIKEAFQQLNWPITHVTTAE
ncbi:hypothetical protein J0X19_12835 [Hymenobacter sp. BT186]|uniref:Uncharacterized protein n=1 Tax=Hymenobacter telluris TaxID=2816474 RepID=A0A939EYE6_9BACT|nr:hypothetical protein [Hymenobacter telluris]MBO0358835.1 hypothetical protein [Hymenobacter telluris]MBW3374861.1 hypothetical protein [Hymenobacter norwichensis]